MALMEPLACVVNLVKKMRLGDSPVAIIGLGAMGLMASLYLHKQVTAVFEIDDARAAHAEGLGLPVTSPDTADRFSHLMVFPGSVKAVEDAVRLALPNAVIGLFAPLPPGEFPATPWEDYYFKGLTFANAYSCDHTDTAIAQEALATGRFTADQVVDRWISMREVPDAYSAMSKGEIRKAMVIFE
jgi:threonine dehydrogenase-like Zn-dependent dehydrogenase